MVIRVSSRATSIGWPAAAVASQVASSSSMASLIRTVSAAMRSRWNCGCIIRRCRSQKVPSLTGSPLPMTRRTFSQSGPPFT